MTEKCQSFLLFQKVVVAVDTPVDLEI